MLPINALRLRGPAGSSGADPFFDDVIALFNMSGANNSTTLVDTSSYARSFTASGSAKIDTSIKLPGSTGSFFLNGGGCTFSGGSEFSLTGEFTIECLFRIESANPNYGPLVGLDSGAFGGLMLRKDAMVEGWITGQSNIETGDNGTVSAFVHAALTRNSSNQIKAWMRGANAGATLTSSATIWGSGASILMGVANFGSGALTDVRLGAVRVTKGVCRYTTTFTPPTTAFPESA